MATPSTPGPSTARPEVTASLAPHERPPGLEPGVSRARHPRRLLGLSSVLLLLVAAAMVWRAESVDAPAAPDPPAETEVVTRVIDAPALDTIAPAQSVVDVKAEYGAVGDGRTDDTAAIQAAISAGVGNGELNKIVYLPAGTYLVTRPLEWRRADGTWDAWLTLMGENRDRTVIRLQDGAAGFGDPANPRAVLVTASQRADAEDGSGNQAHHNFVFDLTVDVGADNPGADGIDYLANNRGAVRNVVVTAPPGSGNTGISITRRWPGPALLQDVRVTGFARGVSVGRWEYSLTVDGLRLSGQREVGLENNNNILTVRGLVSDNSVPAVKNGSPSTRDSVLTLIDSTLAGGAPSGEAIVNDGLAFIRGVTVLGYGTAVRERGVARHPDLSQEWSSLPAVGPAGLDGRSLGLPVEEAPQLPSLPEEQWAHVEEFGAHVGDGKDDTAAIQAALDSGLPIVTFAPGWYDLSATLRVPPSVRAILGFEANLDATRGAFTGSSSDSVFTVTGDVDAPLILHQLVFKANANVVDVNRVGSRPLALQHIHIGGTPFSGSAGKLYLTDVEGGNAWTFTKGQQVWARQLNTEHDGTKIRNQGASLWMLGLKTESPGTALESSLGARTELLGGLLYPSAPQAPSTPAFRLSGNSLQSLTFVINGTDRSHQYSPLIDVTGPDSSFIGQEEAKPRGGIGSMVLLYSNQTG